MTRRQRPETSLGEDELERLVSRLTMKVARVLGDCGPGLFGSVIANLFAMYLWTFPPDKRDQILEKQMELVRRLLAQRNIPQAPPEVRQQGGHEV